MLINAGSSRKNSGDIVRVMHIATVTAVPIETHAAA